MISGVHLLNREYGDDILISNLNRLMMEVERLTLRAASEMGKDMQQVIFLVNNYDCIKTTLRKYNLECEERQRFENLASSQIQKYVEDELAQRYEALIVFVKKSEMAINNDPDFKVDTDAAESIVRDFSQNWNKRVHLISDNVKRNFANGENPGFSAGAPAQGPRRSSMSSSSRESSNPRPGGGGGEWRGSSGVASAKVVRRIRTNGCWLLTLLLVLT
eukprot:TRINITY_DN1825_c0_g1_i1.p1 TRINITY_DN1825_c0_g1~~TRINITY_DN1825_c0_g1_i1.p1  ORF type:complete len:218 (+),score=27.38 TRINITY_DN1825_c0_g1_i1:764-1417(+)